METVNGKKISTESLVLGLSYISFFLSLNWVYKSISVQILAISLTLIVLSILLQRRGLHPPRVFLNIASISILVIQGLKADLDRIVEVGAELILLLLAIKFLEQKKKRDYLEIYLLIVLLLSAGAFFSFGLDFIFGSLIVFFLISLSVVLLTISEETPGVRFRPKEISRIFKFSILLFLLSLFLSSVIFFILPRTDYPIFSFLNKGTKAKTGISDTIRLGDYEELEEDDAVVLRVKTEKIPEELLYWRRCVLDYFDGKEWKRSRERRGKGTKEDLGPRFHQIIFSEEDLSPYLVGLNRPIRIDGIRTRSSKDDVFEVLEPLRRKMRYEVISSISRVELEDGVDPIYLQIPKAIESKIRDIARRIDKNPSSADETVQRIYRFLAEGEYEYSLDNLPVGSGAIEEFLLRSKRGNCEFFASSMALLCRASGIPSRIVTGFRGGEYNEIGNYYIVRRKDAHAWVEVYIQGKGWVSYDPTPSRDETYMWKRREFSKIEKLLDSISYHLTQLVIAYDLEKQIEILTRVGYGLKDFQIKKAKEVFLILLSTLSLLIIILWVRRTIFVPYEERILREFLKRLKRMGIVRKENEGLYELCLRMEDEKLKKKSLDFVRIFHESYFKDRKLTDEEKKILRRILEEIKNFSSN